VCPEFARNWPHPCVSGIRHAEPAPVDLEFNGRASRNCPLVCVQNSPPSRNCPLVCVSRIRPRPCAEFASARSGSDPESAAPLCVQNSRPLAASLCVQNSRVSRIRALVQNSRARAASVCVQNSRRSIQNSRAASVCVQNSWRRSRVGRGRGRGGGWGVRWWRWRLVRRWSNMGRQRTTSQKEGEAWPKSPPSVSTSSRA